MSDPIVKVISLAIVGVSLMLIATMVSATFLDEWKPVETHYEC